VGGTAGPGIAGVTIFAREGNMPKSYIARGTYIVLDVTVFDFSLRNGGSGILNYPDYVKLVAMHEMGHALFSNGHPWSPGVLMNEGGGSIGLTQMDINSIREAYCRQ
jgi:hypothetical protein